MYVIHNTSEKELEPGELKQFFLSHLNRIYCAKTQLEEKLPVIAGHVHASDLRLAVAQTIHIVSVQIGRLQEIYARFSASYTPESCLGLSGFLDEAFQSIGPPLDRPSLQDLSILFYMRNISSIEMVSVEVMIRVADKLSAWNIAGLLSECYDEARQNMALFNSLASTYI
jgi:ferritin-like metal-binding protein YciE